MISTFRVSAAELARASGEPVNPARRRRLAAGDSHPSGSGIFLKRGHLAAETPSFAGCIVYSVNRRRV